MPFALDSDGFYRPSSLSNIPWLFAGFGTRSAIWSGPELATVKQIHSADVIHAEAPGPSGVGDALFTNTPKISLAIKTADCIPILMFDVRQRAIAAVHAGWRGTAQHIGPAAIDAMKAAFASKPEDLHIAIGPGIGPCCYEVGPEVASAFPGHGDKRTHLNLSAINREQLEQAGVPSNQIEESGMCTFCLSESFFSFRREGEQAGRMLSVIGLT